MNLISIPIKKSFHSFEFGIGIKYTFSVSIKSFFGFKYIPRIDLATKVAAWLVCYSGIRWIIHT